MAGLRQDTTYKRELMAGDLIVVRSEILEMREKVIRFFQEMCNSGTGEIAATTRLTAVHINRETRRSCPLPESVLGRGREMIIQLPGAESSGRGWTREELYEERILRYERRNAKE